VPLCLGALRADQVPAIGRHRDGGQDAQDRDHDQQFHQRDAARSAANAAPAPANVQLSIHH
jgi:hypothetical protein